MLESALRSHQKMQKDAAQHDPIQSECRDALRVCCRTTCCWENRQQNLICGAARFDLQRSTPVPALQARSRILRRVKCCSSWNISTFRQQTRDDSQSAFNSVAKAVFCVPFKAASIYAWHAEQAICYDGPLVTVGNVFTWVNNLTVLHHFTISLVNQSLQTFGNKHVLCRCPMSIVTTLGNVAVSCFCWFCLGWVFINIYKKVKSIYIL